MTKEYDHITAFHYSAFRTTLNSQILKEHLDGHSSYCTGLDIKSGAGHFSVALIKHCKELVGIEPYKDMLSKSMPHPRIKYALYYSKHLDF